MAAATDAAVDYRDLIGRRESTGVRTSPARRGVLHPATTGPYVGGAAP